MNQSISIDPRTQLGCVALRVSNLQRSLRFYRDIVGLSVIEYSTTTANMGANGHSLLQLQEVPDARPRLRTAGLYHFAILVPSRLELGRSVRHLISTQTPLQGFADHLVSEAVYFSDPDGNGIEIYRDRPRQQWPYRHGELVMATDPLDVNGLLGELTDTESEWDGLDKDTRIGHIHLQVSSLDESIRFYQDVMGFDLMLRFGPAAAFLSTAGYHHHIGCNTWAGTGIPPAPLDAIGLKWYSIELPDQGAFQAYIQRISELWPETNPQEDGLLVRDPSGNGILLRTSS